MAVCIVMPKAGNSVETCIMGRWNKELGDKIEVGDLLFDYETDKSSFEYRAESAGYLVKKLAEEGDDVPVLTPVCYIGEQGDEVPGETVAAPAPEAKVSAEKTTSSEPATKAVAELPASVKTVVMPKAGNSVETCIMGAWAKEEGDEVKEGDLIFEYETDKSCFEYHAEMNGVLLKKLFSEGDDVPVLTPVCYIGNGSENVSLLQSQTEPAHVEAIPVAEAAIAPQVPAADVVVRSADDKLRISPRARKLAEQMDLSGLKDIIGTGPGGRIIERDVRAYAKTCAESAEKPAAAAIDLSVPAAKAAPAVEDTKERAPDYTEKKLGNIRKVIARNMQASLSEMAQLTNHSSFDATEILEYRSKIKAAKEKMDIPAISLNDIILYAVSRTLLNHPDLNAQFFGDKIRHYRHVHLGMAVDTPRGLMVPTIFNADTKTLAQISAEAKELAFACQNGSINPDKLTGGTFTVTNVGSFGVEMFTPIINPPQTGILGVCNITDRIRKNGTQIEAYPAMGLSLTYDHRIVDGAPASRFLQDLGKALEQFSVLLAK